MTAKPSLLFISPRFLFPTDSGGKIRTTQILRGMKGGTFDIHLVMPCTADQSEAHHDEISSVCDRLISWIPRERFAALESARRAMKMFANMPMPVAVDYDREGAELVAGTLSEKPEVVVFDFPHSCVLAPDNIDVPSVLFTHNVEAEIFKRHRDVATSLIMKAIWRNQYRKMAQFESEVLRRFDAIVTVSARDRDYFENEWGIKHCRDIPTGVDTDFFDFRESSNDREIVFCGSMDWMANIDAMEFFHDAVWPLIIQVAPDANMKVVGRNPPESLVRRIQTGTSAWKFTGFVDDVRDHTAGCAAFVIPLRVGGGTRIKAFEAMAMGCPVVSTSIGIEGLPVEDGVHYLNADTADQMAKAVVSLLRSSDRRKSLANAARRLVESNFGFRKAAAEFESICQEAVQRRNGQSPTNH